MPSTPRSARELVETVRGRVERTNACAVRSSAAYGLGIENAIGVVASRARTGRRADAGVADIDRKHDVIGQRAVVRRRRRAVEAQRRERRKAVRLIIVGHRIDLRPVADIGGEPRGPALTLDLRLQHDILALKIDRSEEHTSELQSLMRNSYTVFSLKQKKIYTD